MMKSKKSILFIAGLTVLISCQNDGTENSVETFNEIGNSFQSPNEGFINAPDEIAFKGGLIQLKEEGNESEKYTIQEITQQKSDIKFRAKRIPTELYLRNAGVSDENLSKALTDVEGEQLFYFEFEEEQKQDLIKKYLQENLDANISYLSFDVFHDFQLINSKGDTISSDYSLYERNFHVAPYERLLVSFSGVDQNEEIQLIYNDKLFGKGELNFNFASTHFLENNIKNPS